MASHLHYHRFVFNDSVDMRFKLNKKSLDIRNSGTQKHERNDLPCFNLPSWTPGTMHTMRVHQSGTGLITVLTAILTGRQSVKNLLCSYGDPMSNNFR